jgi:dihydrofolate reductase
MRRIVVTEFVSLDGVMEDPGGAEDFEHGGWSMQFPDPVGMQYKLDETLGHDALLLGRVTYDGFAKAWPEMKDEAGFADKMNSMPKYVVSNTLRDPSWNNSTVIGGDVPAELAKLKQQPGGDILVAGSQSLIPLLLKHDLVDEIRLMVHPIVLGSGKRVFEGADVSVLRLADSKALDSGALILTYHRK